MQSLQTKICFFACFVVSLQSKHPYLLIMHANILLFGGIGLNEIIIIALVVLLLFGGKKIPELMSGLGKGVKSFKEGMNGNDFEAKDKKNTESKEEVKE